MRCALLLGHREDDGFAGKLAGLILEADLHDLFPLLAQGVVVADVDFDFGAGVVDGVGVDALLDEGVAIFLVQIRALDAFALKARLRLIEAEIHKEAVLDRLLIFVEERRRHCSQWKTRNVSRSMKFAGVAVRPIMRASKYSMTSVKRLKIER